MPLYYRSKIIRHCVVLKKYKAKIFNESIRILNISSLKVSAKAYLKWIRSHWSIESFHWSLDTAFKDDDFQGYIFHLAENFSMLQRLTLMFLKQESSLKKSIPKKRERAGWNNEYLLKVLDV